MPSQSKRDKTLDELNLLFYLICEEEMSIEDATYYFNREFKQTTTEKELLDRFNTMYRRGYRYDPITDKVIPKKIEPIKRRNRNAKKV